MRRIKILFLCFGILLLTGCGMEYSVELNGDKMVEIATIIISNDQIINNSAYKTFEKMIQKYDELHDLLSTYETEEIKEEKNTKLLIKSSYDIDNYENSALFNLCTKEKDVSINSSEIKITTGSPFKCYNEFKELDSVEIKFKTNHKVYTHNADKVKNGTYIWKFTKENANEKKISISMSRNKKKADITPILYLLLISGIIIMAYVVYQKNTSNNAI